MPFKNKQKQHKKVFPELLNSDNSTTFISHQILCWIQKIYLKHQKMLLKDVTTVPLNPIFPKILCASIAYKKTFVLVRVDNPGKEESIIHLDSHGKVLWEHQYKDIINFFGMINDKQVIVLNVPQSTIDILNLETHEIFHVDHQYLFEDVAQMTIETFSETRLFCVKEQGGYNDHRLKLTYYAYQGLKNKKQPVAQWQSSQDEWTYDHMTRKANNHSKIAWWVYKHEQSIVFNYFDLKTDPEGKLQTVKAINTLGSSYDMNNLQIGIGGLWEITPDTYMLVTSTNKNELKKADQNGIVNNNFILNATAGNDVATLRETKFTFEVLPDTFSYNDQVIEFYLQGQVSVFYTFRHEKGEALETPIYYVQNTSEEIVAHETWKCSCYKTNFFFPAWDSNLVVQAEHTNGDCQEVTFSANKVMDPKEIALHFLLELNDNFDDDLLQDTVELLVK